MVNAKQTRERAAADQAGIVTHTTAIVAGEQTTEIAVYQPLTEQTRMTVTIGHLMMTFTSAAAVHKILEGFAAVRPALMGVDNTTAPITVRGADFALNTMSITWIYPPTYAIVRGNRYSKDQRRTIYWVDVHMGPITWRIADHTGYHSLIEGLRNAHRTAVGVFLDGRKYRKDPTDRDAFTD